MIMTRVGFRSHFQQHRINYRNAEMGSREIVTKAAGLGISIKTNTQRQALEDQDLGSRVGRECHGSQKPCNDFITGEPGLLPRNVPAADQLLVVEKGEEPHCLSVWGLGELLCQLQCAVQTSSEHGAMSVDIFLSLKLGDAPGVGRGRGRWRLGQ